MPMTKMKFKMQRRNTLPENSKISLKKLRKIKEKKNQDTVVNGN